jgi:hypothetical protein
VHQHPPDPAPLMVPCYGQRHDLAVIVVALIERADASADESHYLFGVARDQCGLMLITYNRLQPLLHLAG